MMGKQLYKVEITGWVVKEDGESDVDAWTTEAITGSMVGFEVQTTLIDSSQPITFEVAQGTTPVTSDIYTREEIETISNIPVNPMTQGRWGEGIDKPIPEVVKDEVDSMDIELDTKGMSL